MIKNTATLLITCPDQRGIVAEIANFLYQQQANIIHADEHLDAENKIFLMRVEWESLQGEINSAQFQKMFSPLAEKFNMQWQVKIGKNLQKVAIFVSQHDHCLADLLHRHKNGELACEIKLIISNHLSNNSLADFYGIPFYYFPINAENKSEVESAHLKLLQERGIEMIVLARYMQILSTEFVAHYPQRIINIHHSFLPAFTGARPYHRAFERGVKLIGATSHYVTDALDEGPIIEQDITRISHQDSVNDLIRKGRDLERIVLYRAVRWHIENRTLAYGNKTVIFD